MRSSSSFVGSRDTAAAVPITSMRSIECGISGTTFGPSGSRPRCSR